MRREDITPAIVRELMRYDPATGKLFWKKRARKWFKTQRDCNAWNTNYAGKEAFTAQDGNGYHYGHIFGIPFKAQRVAWAISEGEWPPNKLDHRDRNRGNNRLRNLRPATTGQNNMNRSANRSNATGYKGVGWHKSAGRYRAVIKVDGKQIHLGHFDDPAVAAEAYKVAARKHFGEFAGGWM